MQTPVDSRRGAQNQRQHRSLIDAHHHKQQHVGYHHGDKPVNKHAHKSLCRFCEQREMGSSEMLLGDLRSIHGALKELLSSARPDVPSWRFPGRLSASLTLDDLLPGQDDNRVILLEGIVDRLLLLLQASLKLWNEDRSLPLSLSSTVKKFCKQLLQTRDKTHSLKHRVNLSRLTSHYWYYLPLPSWQPERRRSHLSLYLSLRHRSSATYCRLL